MNRFHALLGKATAAARSAIRAAAALFDLRDLHAYVGLVLIGVGLDAVYPPAAWVVVGTILFWLGVRK
jgi:hypothetical protein